MLKSQPFSQRNKVTQRVEGSIGVFVCLCLWGVKEWGSGDVFKIM